MEQDLEEACVYIYAAMGLYEEAVDLALKVWGGGGYARLDTWWVSAHVWSLCRWRMLTWLGKLQTPN